jgi:hypothetical protein
MDPRLDLPNNERQELLSLRTLSDEQGFRSYNVIFDGCTTGEIDLYAWDHLKWIRFYPFFVMSLWPELAWPQWHW